MVSDNPHVSIIMLNWNGWQDTIECLESVLKLDYPDFNILLIDNNSQNESVEKILAWANGRLDIKIKTKYNHLVYPLSEKPVQLTEMEVYDRGTDINRIIKNKNMSKILFIKSQINFGFAIANNIGMEIAENNFESKYYFLLNNDTVIRPEALRIIISAMEKTPEIGAAQATIYHYDKPDRIANAGGRILFWGQTKYYKNILKDSVKKISFINGCALCISSEVVKNIGPLSEKFFFGEEDFEYSMRLKKNKIEKICVADSHVFHKMGTSASELLKVPEKKVMLFAFNRIIDIKSYYSKYTWKIWRFFALSYFLTLLLVKYKLDINRSILIIRFIAYYTDKIVDVKKETWENIMREIHL